MGFSDGDIANRITTSAVIEGARRRMGLSVSCTRVCLLAFEAVLAACEDGIDPGTEEFPIKVVERLRGAFAREEGLVFNPCDPSQRMLIEAGELDAMNSLRRAFTEYSMYSAVAA